MAAGKPNNIGGPPELPLLATDERPAWRAPPRFGSSTEAGAEFAGSKIKIFLSGNN
jgi:hypothetical protein